MGARGLRLGGFIASEHGPARSRARCDRGGGSPAAGRLPRPRGRDNGANDRSLRRAHARDGGPERGACRRPGLPAPVNGGRRSGAAGVDRRGDPESARRMLVDCGGTALGDNAQALRGPAQRWRAVQSTAAGHSWI
ncbi:hypothetical protein SKAU_G00290770 [Synaphobranchus kaupii]|uniref:Uncharacterized protein n=1 Tax=Synaphobranchus kaupii TaxID=118154 RepID=A0A9Q1ETV9_SYNKA|nr:hypothetical protein SKAU_G00290770 [Synaphobranchus kaupii]